MFLPTSLMKEVARAEAGYVCPWVRPPAWSWDSWRRVMGSFAALDLLVCLSAGIDLAFHLTDVSAGLGAIDTIDGVQGPEGQWVTLSLRWDPPCS